MCLYYKSQNPKFYSDISFYLLQEPLASLIILTRSSIFAVKI